MRERRVLALLFSAFLIAAALEHRYPEVPEKKAPAPIHSSQLSSPSCQEDEPCWDCSTMGNKVCGTSSR